MRMERCGRIPERFRVVQNGSCAREKSFSEKGDDILYGILRGNEMLLVTFFAIEDGVEMGLASFY
jgi:hypothetical protein